MISNLCNKAADLYIVAKEKISDFVNDDRVSKVAVTIIIGSAAYYLVNDHLNLISKVIDNASIITPMIGFATGGNMAYEGLQKCRDGYTGTGLVYIAFGLGVCCLSVDQVKGNITSAVTQCNIRHLMDKENFCRDFQGTWQ